LAERLTGVAFLHCPKAAKAIWSRLGFPSDSCLNFEIEKLGAAKKKKASGTFLTDAYMRVVLARGQSFWPRLNLRIFLS